MKPYIRLNAYELGQVMATLSMKRLSPRLKKKFEHAQARIYLDSGFTERQVFGKVALSKKGKK